MNNNTWNKKNIILMEITRKNLKIVFIVHFFLLMFSGLTWGSQVRIQRTNFSRISLKLFWQSSSFVNLVFFLCLLMSITRPDEVEPTLMAVIVNFLSIIHDIIWISYLGDTVGLGKGWWAFSAFMSIFNLIARLPTTFLLYMDFKQLSNKS